jgi:cobalt-precorrin 5A hydrolase/precorrin-3B C17-methyltransferase
MAVNAPVLVALTADGALTAQRIVSVLPGAKVHGYRARVNDADVFFDDLAGHLRALFADGTAIIALCSSGIVVRALAPIIADKHAEPPVIVVADNGRAVVPLLGAHHGGNVLAEQVAVALGVQSAITTASDQRFTIALDTPPAGYVLAQMQRYKPFMARLLAGVSFGQRP